MNELPQHYKQILNSKETEHAIVLIKNFFQTALSTELNLTRVTAPLFVQSGLGINDDLNGVEEIWETSAWKSYSRSPSGSGSK